MSVPATPNELPPVLAFGELIKVLGVGRTWTNQLLREPGFPKPIAVLGVGKIWATADITAYCERVGRKISWSGPATDSDDT